MSMKEDCILKLWASVWPQQHHHSHAAKSLNITTTRCFWDQQAWRFYDEWENKD